MIESARVDKRFGTLFIVDNGQTLTIPLNYLQKAYNQSLPLQDIDWQDDQICLLFENGQRCVLELSRFFTQPLTT